MLVEMVAIGQVRLVLMVALSMEATDAHNLLVKLALFVDVRLDTLTFDAFIATKLALFVETMLAAPMLDAFIATKLALFVETMLAAPMLDAFIATKLALFVETMLAAPMLEAFIATEQVRLDALRTDALIVTKLARSEDVLGVTMLCNTTRLPVVRFDVDRFVALRLETFIETTLALETFTWVELRDMHEAYDVDTLVKNPLGVLMESFVMKDWVDDIAVILSQYRGK